MKARMPFADKVRSGQDRVEDQGRKRPAEITITGVLVLLLGMISAVSIVWEILSPSVPAPVLPPLLVPLPAPSATLLPFTLMDAALLIVCGFGLLRFRPSARHVAMILIAGSLLAHVNKVILFGAGSFNAGALLLHFVLAVFVLWFLGRKKVRKSFALRTGRFRLFSCYGLAVSAVVLLVSLPTMTLLGARMYFAFAFDEPLRISDPPAISLTDASAPITSPDYREITLFGISGSIPQGFALASVDRPAGSGDFWSAVLVRKTEGESSMIFINNRSIFASMPDLQEPMQIKDPFEFELAFRTNSLSPVIAILRVIRRPAGTDHGVVSFRSAFLRGFFDSVRTGQHGRWRFSATLYAFDGSKSGAIDFLGSQEDLTRDDVLRMIASLRFAHPTADDAEKDHAAGLALLAQGDSAGTGFKLANAYFLSPRSARYGVALARYLTSLGPNGRRSAKDVLEAFLKTSPGHPEVTELLASLRAEGGSAL